MDLATEKNRGRRGEKITEADDRKRGTYRTYLSQKNYLDTGYTPLESILISIYLFI
jgi:hypothetical protein